MRAIAAPTHAEHGVDVLPADELAVGEGDGAVQGVHQAGRVRQPHVEEAGLDQNQLVVLTEVQEACRQKHCSAAATSSTPLGSVAAEQSSQLIDDDVYCSDK